MKVELEGYTLPSVVDELLFETKGKYERLIRYKEDKPVFVHFVFWPHYGEPESWEKPPKKVRIEIYVDDTEQ